MFLVIYGPEGSGKGTQAKLLSQKLKLPVITSGDLVREKAAEDTGEIGDICRKALSQGKYVDDETMFILWKGLIRLSADKKGFILDGFPRTLNQAKFLLKNIAKYGYHLDKFIYLKLSDCESIKRLASRKRTLFAGSKILHDDPSRVAKRLKRYHKEEKSILALFQKNNLLTEVNAEGAVEEVFKNICEKLKISS